MFDGIIPHTGDVARLHSEWQDVHSQLRSMEQVLSDAIELYVRGQSPRPDGTMREVERLRAVCGERFQALMKAMKDQAGQP